MNGDHGTPGEPDNDSPRQRSFELLSWPSGKTPSRPEEDRPDYNEVFERVFAEAMRHERALAQERAEAPQLFEELRGLPHNRRRLLLRNSRRFQTWALCQTIIDCSQNQLFTDPQDGLELAELATEIAERLDIEHYGAPQANDMKAAAWCQMANALRVISDLRRSDEAFGIAEHFLAAGSGDLLATARLMDLKSTLRLAQVRFKDAIAFVLGAIDIYRKIGDSRREGAALIRLAAIYSSQGDPGQAVELVNRGMALLDREADRRQLVIAQHNLVTYLANAGRYLEAQAKLVQIRRLHQQSGEEINLIRFRWLEGRVAAGLGRSREAERAFMEAREGFIRHGLGYDAALVSLDLATVYARLNRTEEMKQLALEMLPIFHSRDVHREAVAALLVLHQAIAAERVNLTLVREVASFLEEARENPRRRFEITSSTALGS